MLRTTLIQSSLVCYISYKLSLVLYKLIILMMLRWLCFFVEDFQFKVSADIQVIHINIRSAKVIHVNIRHIKVIDFDT